MNEHLVSVIVPVYNAARTLKRCIDSIRQQTHPRIEIILVNDGSTDASGPLCDAFAADDQRIRTFHQPNQGPAAARNKGIHHAIGTYIQFVDADDVIDPAMTEALVSEMIGDVDLVICGYKANVIQKNNNHTHTHIPSIHGTFTHDALIDHVGTLYEETIFPSPCNKLYKLDLMLTEYVRFIDDFQMGEDCMFNIDYMEVTCAVAIIQEPLYIYIIRDDESLSTRFHEQYAHYQMHIHHHLTEFLQRKNKLHGQNKQSIQRVFMKSVINSLTHLFHPGNTAQKREKKTQINALINEPNVQRYTNDAHGSHQARIVRTLIQRQSVSGIYTFFQLKQAIQHHANPLYNMLKRLDQRK